MFKQLTPLSKFLILILMTGTSLLSYDTRFLGLLALLSFVLTRNSKLRLAKGLLLLILVHLLLLLLKQPDYGVQLYHYNISWLDDFTLQEALYLLTIFFKDVIILNFLLLFLLTSQPAELSASLNRVGLPYRLAYKIGLIFTIVPRFKAYYLKLATAAAAQNQVLSKGQAFKAFWKTRHNETLANRHFGKKHLRTWYASRPMTQLDRAALLLAAFSVIISIGLIFINGGRLWNPFR
ncbi:MAG: hypothetical protein LBS41_03700 [Streptococcaceae bacterium]|jgi:energy-coupling factor transport system permease protein|nr:hypothetical protein [Streptococcaceae bacterium]